DVIAIHDLAFKSGAKAIAIFRDGCKLSQPLQSVLLTQTLGDDDADEMEVAVAAKNVEKVAEIMATNVIRRKLPGKRSGYTQKA
ncbi:hypothetical protein, partial [Escherichia coli]|uniref:hypothetical protein n=1 Tax=Escherichia coli TaxID=562 RepID=UPI001953CF97